MVDFFTEFFKIPRISSANAATHAENDLTQDFLNLETVAPYACLRSVKQDSVEDFEMIFGKVTPR